MAKSFSPSGKLAGKTKFSGRRRSVTRKSGFHVHPGSTGGEFQYGHAPSYELHAGDVLSVRFQIPAGSSGRWVGYGLWYCAPPAVAYEVVLSHAPDDYAFSQPAAPNWSKFGCMWISDGSACTVTLLLRASRRSDVALWDPSCGSIKHPYLKSARRELLGNMYQYSPEAHFYTVKGRVSIRRNEAGTTPVTTTPIPLKTCNRCGRFLPINVQDEQRHLSFSNHCKAANRRPCRHHGFGVLTNVETKEPVMLEYGFQLECRFCKKFAVNAAHNPRRTTAQMKEDGARRRALELLLTEFYGGSPQLRYRHEHGAELTDDVWKRFGKKCFACGRDLKRPRNMRLDHTRPLALLWPLDGTATSLCGNCNSKKRDRPPSKFYSMRQLTALAGVTGIPLQELLDPSPNLRAVRTLKRRLTWFFDDFLCRPELTKERDGKVAGELLVKALSKVLSLCPAAERFDLEGEFDKRR